MLWTKYELQLRKILYRFNRKSGKLLPMLPVRRVQNSNDRHPEGACRLCRQEGILKNQTVPRRGTELRGGKGEYLRRLLAAAEFPRRDQHSEEILPAQPLSLIHI